MIRSRDKPLTKLPSPPRTNNLIYREVPMENPYEQRPVTSFLSKRTSNPRVPSAGARKYSRALINPSLNRYESPSLVSGSDLKRSKSTLVVNRLNRNLTPSQHVCLGPNMRTPMVKSRKQGSREYSPLLTDQTFFKAS